MVEQSEFRALEKRVDALERQLDVISEKVAVVLARGEQLLKVIMVKKL